MTVKLVYMDNNATTPLHPEVQQTIIDNLSLYGNPSSLHSFGRAARQLVEEARVNVADLIGALPHEVIFVGSGSEANNTVLQLMACHHAQCMCQPGTVVKNSIVTTKIEHPCVLETAKCLGQQGVMVSFLPVDEYGKVVLSDYQAAVTDSTRLVSVMMANNEIGTIQDIKTLAALAHQQGALFHTDAVQAVGKIPVDVRQLDIDFLTISGHKIYGPKGIGALYIKNGVPYCPLIHGGHQERGRRAGTENTLGIIALGKAVQLRKLEMADEETRLLALKDALRNGIQESIPDVRFNGHPTDCLPGTLNVSFEGAEGEAILLYLDLAGIAVSTGSACASGSLDPSHVLLATGLSAEFAHGSIRFSLGRQNTFEDVEYVVANVAQIIARLREMSTVYRRK